MELSKNMVGKLFFCHTIYNTTRVMRYGYHRKYNPDNWGELTVIPTNVIWVGWRDNKNGRFYREDEILSWEETHETN